MHEDVELERLDHPSCCERTTERNNALKGSLVSRLNRIEGQIRGIKGMVESDVYCDDVLIQISAAQAALNAVSKIVLKDHVKGCVVSKIANGDKEIADELIVTIGRLYK